MLALELALDPGGLARLTRLPGVTGGRSAPFKIVWHDTADSALATAGLSLSVQAGLWRLERLALKGPGQTPEVLAEARNLAGLATVPDGVSSVATLLGRRRTLHHGAVTLRATTASVPGIERLLLEGPGDEISALAQAIAHALPVRPALASLASEVLDKRCPIQAAPVQRGQDVSTALSIIVAGLATEMLRWPGQMSGASMEPVHQMRVATRRLRSALSVFRLAAPCPEVETLRTSLHTCAGTLGAARDWDVFLDGTGARLAGAFPDERRVAALLRAGARQRLAAYVALRAYLDSPDFRVTMVGLAAFSAVRPWPTATPEPIEEFAAAALEKRARQVRKAGRKIETLPVEALHELRKDCKRLRYSAEFFANLFPPRPTRRYIRRLAALQEELGRLNDGAAVPALLAQLGRAERGYAGGLVEGFSAAHAAPLRDGISAAWNRFKKADPFWTE